MSVISCNSTARDNYCSKVRTENTNTLLKINLKHEMKTHRQHVVACWQHGTVVSRVRCTNEVNACQARLVLG